MGASSYEDRAGELDELRKFRLDALYRLMSDISEDCWCAGWLIGNERALYKMAFECGDSRYGMSHVRPDDLVRLQELATQTGCWFHWPKDVRDGPIPITLEDYRALYAQAIEAGTGETERLDPQDESAVATPCAQTQEPNP